MEDNLKWYQQKIIAKILSRIRSKCEKIRFSSNDEMLLPNVSWNEIGKKFICWGDTIRIEIDRKFSSIF